jgi:adenosine deaminase
MPVGATPPTAELHVHIEGTLEPEMVLALAARHGARLPTTDLVEFRARYAFTDLQSFLDLHYANLLVLRGEEDFYELAVAYLGRAQECNVRRAEIFFDPHTHLANGVSLGAVINGLAAGLRDGERRHHVSADLIMCFLRHLGADAADEMFTAVLPFRDHIVGVGLDSTEIGFPNPLFADVFARAAAEGLHLVAHAGEEGDAQCVAETLDSLHVERIDHGVGAMDDPEVVARLRADQTPLTVCPLSNVRLHVVDTLADHPLAAMLDADLHATVNSDDPAYFGGYVDANYRAVRDELGLTTAQLETLALNSFDASFAPPELREAWKDEVHAWSTNKSRLARARSSTTADPTATLPTKSSASSHGEHSIPRTRRSQSRPPGSDTTPTNPSAEHTPNTRPAPSATTDSPITRI